MRAGWRLELPYSSRLCRSAGATAGMASLAACSTEKPAWQAWRHAPRRSRHGKPGGLLHANIRCGTQDCVLHGEDGVARSTTDARAGSLPNKGRLGRVEAACKGHPGRLESRPQARKPAPQQLPAPTRGPRPHQQPPAGLEACPTSKRLHHEWGLTLLVRTRRWNSEGRQRRIPAMQADMKLAIVPAATAFSPRRARSDLRLGASAPMPPI